MELIGAAAWRVLKHARQAAMARHERLETGQKSADAERRGVISQNVTTRQPAASATAERPVVEAFAPKRSRKQRSAGLE